MISGLYYKYPSTAMIRFKRENVWQKDHLYRILTDKLDFIIPKQLVILSGDYVFIPNSYYQKILEQYYLDLKVEKKPLVKQHTLFDLYQ